MSDKWRSSLFLLASSSVAIILNSGQGQASSSILEGSTDKAVKVEIELLYIQNLPEPKLPPLAEMSKYIPTEELYRGKISHLSKNSQAIHLVIKLSDRHVYVYQKDQVINVYPVAIGKAGWETPTGDFIILNKIINPTWQHPLTGKIIPPGADNPLGSRWIGFWTDGTNFIGFHGTPEEELIGQAVSHGCVRMRNQDVQALFEQVELGTTVTVEP